MKHIARLIQTARKNKGLTQSELTQALGWANYDNKCSYMNRMEHGKIPFPPKKIKLLAKTLSIEEETIVHAMMLDYADKIIKQGGL